MQRKNKSIRVRTGPASISKTILFEHLVSAKLKCGREFNGVNELQQARFFVTLWSDFNTSLVDLIGIIHRWHNKLFGAFNFNIMTWT